MTSFVVTAVHFHRLGHLSFEMAGQVLPSAEGNIRQKMADLHLDLASQEVTYLYADNWGSSEEKDAAGVE